ncbi:hypothetical protein GALMADRAFT_135883 [Galerina marginata CBS 339.88]|uniref:BTB domain-containing protein n=1 Tax=Galerina marginata (strain CBS 339.88) TaxID=685588 RepID=A0A067TEJ1_GALM3|nr:hypothetical protein GALMADRAFT_135883 [Galerina marginata CBS 339.88]
MHKQDSREAGPPFQSTARTDVVLRSSDNVDFYLMRAFLAFCSPVLESKLSQPPSYNVNDVPDKCATGSLSVIVLMEDSNILEQLLRLCYPGTSLEIQNLDDIVAVKAAAAKYSIDILEEELRKRLLVSPVIEKEPLGVFCIAFHYGWEDVGRLAAKNTLTMNILPFCKWLEYLTGVELFRLEEYRRTCGEAIVSWMEEQSYSSFGASFVWHVPSLHSAECTTSGDDRSNWFKNMTAGRPLIAKSWWKTYYNDLLIRLRKHPIAITALDDEASNAALECAKPCPVCSGPRGHKDMANYKKLVAAAVETVVGGIVLEVKFKRPSTDLIS